jgi:MFS family permease
MKKGRNQNRWIFIIIFFFFLIFHQLESALLRNLTPEIMGEIFTEKIPANVLSTLSFVILLMAYLVWGYLFDKQPRTFFLSWGSAIWWITSWMMGLSPSYETFVISYLLGTIDNAVNSGIYSFTGDIFSPKNRGKVIGIFTSTFPLTLFLSAIIIPRLRMMFEWRVLYFIFGSIGLLFAFLIVIFIKCPKRGEKEPALAKMEMVGKYSFDWEYLRNYLRHASVILIFGAGFFWTISWVVLNSRLSIYVDALNTGESITLLMRAFPALIAIGLGSPLSGMLGDMLFRKKKTGRIIVSFIGTGLTLIFLLLAFINLDIESNFFGWTVMLMGLFMSFSIPNLLASIMDIALPEIRSFIIAIFLLILALPQFFHPYLMAVFQRFTDLRSAILWLCLGSWGLSILFQIGLFVKIPGDIEHLRRHMARRSQLETQLAAANREDTKNS